MGGMRRNRAKTDLRGLAVGGGGPGAGRRCLEKHRQGGKGRGRWKPRVKGAHVLSHPPK